MPVLRLPLSEEQLSELAGEGDLEFFVRLPIHGESRIVYLHVRHRKFYDLLQTARVSGADRTHLQLIEGARLEDE
jgi:hypothetical protein